MFVIFYSEDWEALYLKHHDLIMFPTADFLIEISIFCLLLKIQIAIRINNINHITNWGKKSEVKSFPACNAEPNTLLNMPLWRQSFLKAPCWICAADWLWALATPRSHSPQAAKDFYVFFACPTSLFPSSKKVTSLKPDQGLEIDTQIRLAENLFHIIVFLE